MSTTIFQKAFAFEKCCK